MTIKWKKSHLLVVENKLIIWIYAEVEQKWIYFIARGLLCESSEDERMRPR